MRVEGELAAEFTLQRTGPNVPMATWVLRPRLRTIGQQFDGQTFEITPRARGRVARAKVEHAWSDESLFPALNPSSIALAVRLSRVQLQFPEPTVR